MRKCTGQSDLRRRQSPPVLSLEIPACSKCEKMVAAGLAPAKRVEPADAEVELVEVDVRAGDDVADVTGGGGTGVRAMARTVRTWGQRRCCPPRDA